MAIDPRYIPAFSIEDVLLDKDTGAPLSGGLVYFEQDNQRGVLKPVYQITGTSPNYSYTQLPNPMTLSSIGTFEDALANPTVPYFYPYDADGVVEYYYVRVTSSEDVPQFVREAVPYVVDTGGSSSVIDAFANELSNPQFAQVLFDTTTAATYVYSFTSVSDQVVNIAPDWDLIVTAPTTGTVTVSQLKPTGSLNIVTNPGTLLNITSAGLTKLHLRQRLYGSPNLWGDGYLSASFVAKTYSGTNVTLGMYYSQSDGVVIDQLLTSGVLAASGSYAAHPGSVLIPVSTSSQNFPTSYVDIFFVLPLSIEIDITSIMVACTGATPLTNILYDQETLSRQIDHLYHYAYPIIPIGGIIDFAGFTIPAHYLLCDGQAIDRVVYYDLFRNLTTTETVALTNTVATFTVVSTANYHIGMPLEGTGIAASTTITNIVGTTITMSNAATATVSSSVRFFAWGAGNGTTTFNVPNLLGYTTAGANGTLYSNVNGVGLMGGTANHTLLAAELPPHTHDYTHITNSGVGGFGLASGTLGTFPTYQTGNGPGTSQAFSIVQPTALMKKCIRVQ